MAASLSESHELQVQSYLRFAKLKRDQHVREAVACLSDYRDDRLRPGELMNYKDLTELFDDMSESMRTLVDKECAHAYHISGLLVKLLLAQAQANGLELAVDIQALENEFLLKQIASSESTALSRPASDFVRRNNNLGRVNVSINNADPQAAQQVRALQEELAATQERLARLQEQTTQSMRGRTAANDEVAALRDELADKDRIIEELQRGQSDVLNRVQQDFAALSTQAKGAAAVSQTQFEDIKRQMEGYRSDLQKARQDLAQAQHELGQRESELANSSRDLESRVADSKQFQQLKKMMQQKSQEVVDLRRKLNKYEPQSVPSADNY